MSKTRLFSMLFATLAVGCGASWRDVRTDDAFRASGLSRAAFELSCPSEQIRVTPMTSHGCRQREDGPYVCAGEQVGVEGCGKKTTYVFPPLGRGDDWVRDSEIIESPRASE